MQAAYFPDTFEYALTTVSASGDFAPPAPGRVSDNLFSLQDELSDITVDDSGARPAVVRRLVDPWKPWTSNKIEPVHDGEFTVGERYESRSAGETFVPTVEFNPDRAGLADAERDLRVMQQSVPDLAVLYRRRYSWAESEHAGEATAVVRAHMLAAKLGDVATLRRLATGPLLADMGRLTDMQIESCVADVYENEPTVLAFASTTSAPTGHHHVFTNAPLHFDVDNTTGRWLIRQVRLMKLPTRHGFLWGCWRSLLPVDEADDWLSRYGVPR